MCNKLHAILLHFMYDIEHPQILVSTRGPTINPPEDRGTTNCIQVRKLGKYNL